MAHAPFARLPEPYRSEALGTFNSLRMDGIPVSAQLIVAQMEARLRGGEREKRKRRIEQLTQDTRMPMVKVRGTPLPPW
jgi:hypothetical protein